MERNRTSGAWSPGSRSSFWWNTSQNPKPTPTFAAVADCFGSRAWMKDYVTPRFDELSGQGKIINNPMSRVVEDHDFNSFGPKFKTTVGGITYWGELLGGPWGDALPSAASLSGRVIPGYQSLLDEVRTRALNNVKPPDYEGLVALGELRETLRYLKNPFKTGMKLAGALERGIGGIKRKAPDISRQIRDNVNSPVVREVENLYLEFRYGVRPLISDVTNFLEALRKSQPTPERQTFRASSKDVYDDSWQVAEKLSNVSYTANYKYHRDVTIRAGLLYEYSHALGFSEKWGLDLSQLPSAAWELVPLSFVADWFVNVGDFIGAITPVYGASRLAEWTTIEVKEFVEVTRTNWTFSTWTTAAQGGGVDTWRKSTYYRVPSIGTPSIVIKNKYLDTFRDPYKVLDLIGISHQRVRSSIV